MKDSEKTVEQLWVENYAKRYDIPVINESIRVEQGEYSIADRDVIIGTYNVQQCIVIHAINAEKNIHGLAHIDGHTTMASLKDFFTALEANTKRSITIQLLGSHSTNIMGLNDSAANIRKVRKYLCSDIKSSLINPDIDQLIDQRISLSNFVIDGDGQVRPGIASGGFASSLLHTIQAIKRQDRYMGPYPLCEAAGSKNTDGSIFLDERALVMLKEYEKDLTKRTKSRDIRDLDDYSMYDASIPIILDKWNEEVKKIIEQANVNDKLDTIQLQNILKRTPLYIGGDTLLVKNQKIINSIRDSNTLQEVHNNLLAITENSITINDAIAAVKKYDDTLNTQDVLQSLTEQYNESYNSNLTREQVSRKAYAAEISLESFFQTICKHSSILKSLRVLNSQGGYSSDGKFYTIQNALEAAETLGLKELVLKAVANYNNSLELSPIQDDIQQAIGLVVASDDISLSRRDTLILDCVNSINDLESKIASIKSVSDKKTFLRSVTDKVNEYVEIRKASQTLDGSKKYAVIQNNVLTTCSIKDFCSRSVSMLCIANNEGKDISQPACHSNNDIPCNYKNDDSWNNARATLRKYNVRSTRHAISSVIPPHPGALKNRGLLSRASVSNESVRVNS